MQGFYYGVNCFLHLIRPATSKVQAGQKSWWKEVTLKVGCGWLGLLFG